VTVAALLARLVLVGVFALSGAAKLREPRAATTKAARDLGLPAALATPAGTLLPYVELLVAAALLLGGPPAFAGGLAGAAMLAAFTVAIVANLALGRRPDCHCFGERSAKPLSWLAVVRNAALLALTAPVVAAGTAQPYALGALRRADAREMAVGIALVLLVAAVAVLGTACWALFRRYGGLLLRVDELEARLRGEDVRPVASDFDVPDLRGGRATLGSLTAAAPAILVFTSTNCLPCQELAPSIGEWASTAQVTFAVLSAGEPEAALAKFATADAVRVLHDDAAVAAAYGVDATPAAVVVTPDGRVSAGPAFGGDAIRELVAPYVTPLGHVHQIEPRPLAEGDPAPAVTLTDEAGATVDPALVEDEAVLLFWDPACGFAGQIRADVVAWEAANDPAPLVLVSAGEPAAVRASGLRSRLVLDPHFAAGSAYGAPGTPSAVAVRQGRIASPVAVGGPDVLDLLRGVR
jgi:thiol-disulfide isomerase/thioredoxin